MMGRLGNFPVASALFCLAGATDLADGWIARNFKVGPIFFSISLESGYKFVLEPKYILILNIQEDTEKKS
jgi:phosphatidylserine synthase